MIKKSNGEKAFGWTETQQNKYEKTYYSISWSLSRDIDSLRVDLSYTVLALMQAEIKQACTNDKSHEEISTYCKNQFVAVWNQVSESENKSHVKAMSQIKNIRTPEEISQKVLPANLIKLIKSFKNMTITSNYNDVPVQNDIILQASDGKPFTLIDLMKIIQRSIDSDAFSSNQGPRSGSAR